jgi:hypothetical protein
MLSLISIPVNFKEVFTTDIRQLHLNPNWTVAQMIETVRPIIEQEFNCEQQYFDIVATGQDAPGIPAEAGFPLQKSNTKIKDMWGNELHIAFYIRRKNVVYPQLQNLNRNLQSDPDVNPIITQSAILHECPICYQLVPMINRYRCTHQICTECYYRCLNTNNNTCPLCRGI